MNDLYALPDAPVPPPPVPRGTIEEVALEWCAAYQAGGSEALGRLASFGVICKAAVWAAEHGTRPGAAELKAYCNQTEWRFRALLKEYSSV